ncbi:MAG TPA: PQQ-binding-like beta-propeller repeat protein [Blastocatellia bacterium]|nr:PQQ-binding-like beta-propeller repeat protein [Blastocatellia bacterium]
MRALKLIILASLLAPTGPAFSQSSKQAESNQSAAKTNAQDSRAEAGAISTSRLALPFKRAWQHLTEEAITLSPTVDEARIYLPLAGGRVFCLDRQTGSLLWSAEPGGIISAPVAVAENSVYIATRKIAEDGSDAGATLRAVDKATGLTLWVHDYARAFTSPLAQGQGRIYAGSADGSFYSLDSTSGDIIWKIQTQDAVRGCALVTERAVYFGSDDGALRIVESERGHLIWKIQTGGKVVGRPAIDDRALYFGSADGYVYSIDLATYRLRWRSRTGAAVEASPVIVGDRLLVASFDNFIYCLSRANGDRMWKRRLENRITAAPLVEGDAAMVAPFRGDYVAVFLNSDGRRVNLYQLDKEYEIVAEPIFSGNQLVLSTNKGLVVANTTRPTDSRANAIKK